MAVQFSGKWLHTLTRIARKDSLDQSTRFAQEALKASAPRSPVREMAGYFVVENFKMIKIMLVAHRAALYPQNTLHGYADGLQATIKLLEKVAARTTLKNIVEPKIQVIRRDLKTLRHELRKPQPNISLPINAETLINR